MARPSVADERREQILAAFEDCVVRQGLDRTTLNDIAEAAGQPRSLIRHFTGNRENLVSLLIERVLARTEAQMQAVHAALEDDLDPARLARIVMTDLFSDAVTTRLVAELWLLSARSEDVHARLTELYGQVVDALATPRDAEAGDRPDPARRDAVLAVFSLGLGMTVLRHFGLEAHDPDRLISIADSLLNPQPGARTTQRVKRT
jgi:AcrR family transcriptional regulator